MSRFRLLYRPFGYAMIADFGVTLDTATSRPALSWTNPFSTDYVDINIYRDAALIASVGAVPGTRGSYIDMSAELGETYSYHLIATGVGGANPSEPTKVVTIEVLDVTPPTTPVLDVPEAGDGQATIRLLTPSTDNVGVLEYYLCRTDNGSSVKKSNLFEPVLEGGFPYVDTGLTNGKTYKYAVYSRDAAGNESELSNEVVVVPSVPPVEITVSLAETVKRSPRLEPVPDSEKVLVTISGPAPGRSVYLYDDQGGVADHFPDEEGGRRLSNEAAVYNDVTGNYELYLALDPGTYNVAAWSEEDNVHSINAPSLLVYDNSVISIVSPGNGATLAGGATLNGVVDIIPGPNNPIVSVRWRYRTGVGTEWVDIPGSEVLAAAGVLQPDGVRYRFTTPPDAKVPDNSSITHIDALVTPTHGSVEGAVISVNVTSGTSNAAPVVTLDALPTGKLPGEVLEVTFTVTDDAAVVLAGITALLDYTTTPIPADSIVLVSGNRYKATWTSAPAEGEHPLRVQYTDEGSLTGTATGTVTIDAPPVVGGLVDELLWALEFEAGALTTDAVGNITVTAGNNPTADANGKVGGCIRFAGTGRQYLSIPNTTYSRNGTKPAWEYAFLVNPDNFDNSPYLLCKAYTGTEFELAVRLLTSGEIIVQIGNAVDQQGITTEGTLTALSWNALFVGFDETLGVLEVQINDSAPEVLNITVNPDATTNPLYIGLKAPDSNFFQLDGAMDQMYRFNRKLTGAERTWLYNGGAWRSYADLASYQPEPEPVVPAYVQSGADGIICVEAHHYMRNTPGTTHAWEKVNDALALGGSVMMASPNNGTGPLGFGDPAAPVMEYDLRFTETGTHYVWLRGRTFASLVNDTCWYQFNGGPGVDLGGGTWTTVNDYTWVGSGSGGRTTIDVPAPGVYTLKISMRRDGLRLDRVLVTKSSAYDPNTVDGGVGPSESTLEEP